MATTAARVASAADSYAVPDWVEKNSQLFKVPPTGFDRSKVKSALSAEQRDALVASMFKTANGGLLDAGVGGAELTDDEMGNIDLPIGPQPSDYWRNVENHGNVLVTFITTARRKVGFVPALSGTQFTKEEAEEYTRKFSAWMAELDAYVGYIHLVNWAQQTKTNDTTDCNVILAGISEFVVGVAGLVGTVAEAMASKITALVKSAANFTTTTSATSVNAGFTLETTETSGVRDPVQPVSYAATIMSKTQSGKSTSESSSITLASYIYKLNSAAIISMADQLAAGSTLSGSLQYRDYVNAPLNASRVVK